MKKYFFIFLLGCATSMMAADVTYVFSEQGFPSVQKMSSGVIDANHDTKWYAIGGQPEAVYYDDGQALRLYRGAQFKVSSKKIMTNITLTLGSGSKTKKFDQDEIQTPNDTVFTWTFTSDAGNVRVQKIEITYVDYYSVNEVMTIYSSLELNDGVSSTENYKVRGYVTKWNSGYPTYQNADYFMDDSADGSISLLRCYRLVADNENDKRKLEIGEEIEVTAYLSNFKGQAELKDGSFRILSSVTPPPPVSKTYTLTITAGNGGSVNSNVNGTYEEGTQVTIIATADEGYLFKQWSDGNTQNPRVITMTQNFTISAEFEIENTCLHPELEGKKGREILVALHEQIVNHTVLDYDAVRGDRADVDFRDDGTLWDMYSDCTFYKNSTKCGTNVSESTPDCNCYNREHVVPQSWWGNDNSQPMRYDLHNVISTDGKANYMRHADAYGEVYGTPVWSNSLGSKEGESNTYSGGNYKNVFEPVDMYKGDIARIVFYMATCYMDKNFQQGGQGYRMFKYNNSTASLTTDAIELLLRWHRADSVSEKEIKRNDAVEKKQGNRNPFVDDPELVEYIWGYNVAKIYSCSKEEAVENITINHSATKLILDGKLLILRGDKTYTLTGQEVK